MTPSQAVWRVFTEPTKVFDGVRQRGFWSPGLWSASLLGLIWALTMGAGAQRYATALYAQYVLDHSQDHLDLHAWTAIWQIARWLSYGAYGVIAPWLSAAIFAVVLWAIVRVLDGDQVPHPLGRYFGAAAYIQVLTGVWHAIGGVVGLIIPMSLPRWHTLAAGPSLWTLFPSATGAAQALATLVGPAGLLVAFGALVLRQFHPEISSRRAWLGLLLVVALYLGFRAWTQGGFAETYL